MHVDGVADKKTGETEFAADNPADAGSGLGEGVLAVNFGQHDMGGHSGRRVSKLFKRPEVGLQFGKRESNHRHLQMRVRAAGAQSGQVFDTGADAVFDISIDHLLPQGSNNFPVGAECPAAQYCRGFAVANVYDRSIIPVDTRGIQILGNQERMGGSGLFAGFQSEAAGDLPQAIL